MTSTQDKWGIHKSLYYPETGNCGPRGPHFRCPACWSWKVSEAGDGASCSFVGCGWEGAGSDLIFVGKTGADVTLDQYTKASRVYYKSPFRKDDGGVWRRYCGD